MPQLFANNAVSLTSGLIGPTDTTINLQPGDGAKFPNPGAGEFFYATLIGYDAQGKEDTWEIIQVTARATDALTVVRGQEGTTATTWVDSSVIELRMTAAGINDKMSHSEPQLTGDMDLNSNGIGEIFTAATGNTFAAGDVGYLNSSGEMVLTDASALGTCDGVIGMSIGAVSPGATGFFVLLGLVSGLSGLTAGSVYWLSETAGAITTTAPTTASAGVRKVGVAVSTTALMFNPSMTIVVK